MSDHAQSSSKLHPLLVAGLFLVALAVVFTVLAGTVAIAQVLLGLVGFVLAVVGAILSLRR